MRVFQRTIHIISLIFLIRYFAIKLSHRNRMIDDRLALRISLLVIALFLAFVSVYVLYRISNGQPYSFGTELCLRGDNAAAPARLAKLPSLPVYAAAAVSILFDILVVSEANKINHNHSLGNSRQQRQRKAMKRLFCSVPVKATVFSALTSLPMVVMSVLMNLAKMPKETIVMAGLYLSVCVISLRPSITTRAIFAKKLKQDLRSREERRRREIEYAAEERAKREMRKLDDATTAFKRERLDSTFTLHN